MDVWNYRLVKDKDNLLGIHEVYYDGGIPHSMSTYPLKFEGCESIEDLKWEWQAVGAALGKDVLDYKLFEKD
jgi:hypothetical protein